MAGYQFHMHQQALRPVDIARTISNDLAKRERAFSNLVADKQLVKRIFTDSLTGGDVAKLQREPFYLFAYANDTLQYWNSNEVLADCDANDKQAVKLLHHQRGYFFQECFAVPGAPDSEKLTILFPIVTLYPLENNYLQSHFAAADYIPVNSQISPRPLEGGVAVNNAAGKPICYILVHAQDLRHLAPDALTVLLIILALFVTISWIQLITINLAEKYAPWIGFSITIVLVAGLRSLIYIYGVPFGLSNLPFFSPSLYASSSFLPSLADLILNILCLLWIVVFLLRHIPFKKPLFSTLRDPVRIAIGVILIAALIGYAYVFMDVIKGLVLNSNISFDVSHFYSINSYTIIGLLAISLFTATSCLIVYIVNIQLNHLFPNRWFRYALLGAICIGFILASLYHKELYNAAFIGWLMLFIILLDMRALSLVSDLFAPHMVFWALFVCSFSVAILQHINHIKEGEERKLFAEQNITPERENVTEFAFAHTAQSIQNDKIIRSYFNKPTPAARRQINQHLDATYLGGQLDKYQSRIYLFDENGRSLANKDTLTYQDLVGEVNSAVPTMAEALFYREYAANSHNYIAYIPIDDTADNRLGYIFIDLAAKQAANETVYPELLQPATIKSNVHDQDYAYGIYENRKLVVHTHDYPFPDYLKYDTLRVNSYAFYDKSNFSELWYRYSDKKTIVVVHNHNVFIETITLFSYLFGIEILIAILIMLYQLYLAYLVRPRKWYKLTNLTFRKRIHFSMLLVVFVSFLIIGIVTIAFFRDRYETSNITKLESAMQVVEQSVQKFLKQNKALQTENTFDSLARSAKFKPFITDLAADQKIDINIYDVKGQLEATSQDDIYNRALLAGIIRPDAFYQLNTLGKSLLIQNEKIGKLSYLSCYVPLHDEHGTTFGYINVPFFSSEQDLNFQISNIVVTLINLYAFIFLISSLMTLFITRRLTSSFNTIIAQFNRLNLQRNEPIKWPYDDEIGLLVAEYNKMVKKLEENAALLAQSERESAWREMARQVAHEIKNPLTPMKLNIQYLQQALQKNYPNARELTAKVADSLVEQIDNLSYIASEFSNFAKMPEAKPEELEINTIMETALELYRNEPNLSVTISKYAEPLKVYMDKSQLLRVFTNLLENARQAIPIGKQGNITVSVTGKDGHVIIAVADNGAGIAADAVSKIFQPYFTTKSSGTGLGLAMTKKIIEFWKGHIWFETHVNAGTTFYVELPVSKHESQ